MGSLWTRFVIILAVVVLAAWSVYPPQESIKLGLDLRGGMHLVLQVETDDALRAETNQDMNRLEQELKDLGVDNVKMNRTGDTAFTVTGVPRDRDGDLEDDILDVFMPGWEYSRTGEILSFSMRESNKNELRDLAVRQALETIRNRIDAFGVSEPLVHREGLSGNRIVVQLPGVDDPERVKDLIKNTAFLEFRLVKEDVPAAETREQLISLLGGSVPNDVEVMREIRRDANKQPIGEIFWALEKRQVLTGRDLKTARSSSGEFNEPVVSFILTPEGGRKFGDVTSANIGRNLAIVLDGNVMSAPTIQDRITDQGVIHGSFTQEEVQDMVTVLRSGALPAGLTYLEERTVGPTLGQDSIEKGEKAGIYGLALVILTMLIVYQLTGLNAVLALTLNIVLVFGALAMFNATLTLPGIAGIVLTVGMAVDANVLVFERIREELRAGRTVKSAIAAGFEKALSSVLDANFTTLIAALFLFMFGTGPIRGFAVTLSIGILASLFTAIFVSRWLFDLIYTRRQRVEEMSI